jgi:UDP-N-acetylmuramate dehydrogenase
MSLTIEHQVDLQPLHTLAMPAQAEHYCLLSSPSALPELRRQVRANGWRHAVLAGGSNSLCEAYVPGLVVQPAFLGLEVIAESAESVLIRVGAGENWHQLVVWSLKQGFYGLENLALIPGWVGAAPIQNIGAYGVELADVLVSVTAFAWESGSSLELPASACALGYRDSRFKQDGPGQWVITAVTLRLSRHFVPHSDYAPLAAWFADRPVTAEALFERVCFERQQKLPDPKDIPNCGSFFKNPMVSQEQAEAFKCRWPAMPQFPAGAGVKIPAAWLIDQLGFKGQSLSGFRVHDKQALVLINPDRCGAAALRQATDQLINAVAARFDIALEPEPQWLGQGPGSR